jgi:putative effector of murein hydrolase LrgA (UPF0299 family)
VSSTGTGTVWLIILLILYFVPAGVAVARRVPHWGSVLVIDLFLGWTVLGWIIALALACRSRERPPGVTASRRADRAPPGPGG